MSFDNLQLNNYTEKNRLYKKFSKIQFNSDNYSQSYLISTNLDAPLIISEIRHHSPMETSSHFFEPLATKSGGPIVCSM